MREANLAAVLSHEPISSSQYCLSNGNRARLICEGQFWPIKAFNVLFPSSSPPGRLTSDAASVSPLHFTSTVPGGNVKFARMESYLAFSLFARHHSQRYKERRGTTSLAWLRPKDEAIRIDVQWRFQKIGHRLFRGVVNGRSLPASISGPREVPWMPARCNRLDST